MSNLAPSSERAMFIAQWQAAGPLLAAQSTAEFRQMSHRQRQQQIDNLLNLGFEFRRDRIDDGLVRRQQIMRLLDQVRNNHP